MVKLLVNPYFVAIGSPILLLFVGAIGKMVIRGGFSWRVFCLGFDAALTALYAGMVYLYDLARDANLSASKIEITAGFLIVTFLLFMVVVCTHQLWEKPHRDAQPIRQFIVLGVLANLIGFGLLVAFILLVKGVS